MTFAVTTGETIKALVNPRLDVETAYSRIDGVIFRTPLQLQKRLSEKYQCKLYFKREDLQPVRSYKLRGAYNKISAASKDSLINGVVCASAGNHAQGVAFSCQKLKIRAVIFMPANTPDQKLQRVKVLGADQVHIVLTGESYDECAKAAERYCTAHKALYIPPFDDLQIIEGQATVGLEILEDCPSPDYVFVPIGGGGLAAGICAYFSEHSPQTKIIGVEPSGAASMTAAFANDGPVKLEKINSFVDGAAVQMVGKLNYPYCKTGLHKMYSVEEGKVCSTLLQLYNDDGIVTEPAGTLSVAALDDFALSIKDKTVVCIISGGNNDSNRMEDIKKLAHEWEGLQHYLMIRFHHHPEGLSDFFQHVLVEGNYVNRIEYNRRDHGRSTYGLVGVRSESKQAYSAFMEQLKERYSEFKEVSKEDFLFKYWV